MRNSKEPQDPKQTDRATSSDAPASSPEDSANSDYDFRNSGRRAAGHGGGDLDRPEEFPDAHHEAGYEFSGGGRGHEPNRSLAQESDEDLESRSGPFTRAGQPAQPRGEAEDTDPTDSSNAGKN